MTTLHVLSEPGGCVQPLDWDTDFFRARMGRLEIDPAWGGGELESAIARAAEAGYHHLILRCDGDDWPLVRAAESAGMHLVDVGVDLRVDLRGMSAVPCRDIRVWTPADLAELRRIASRAFVYSRFAVDPFFSGQQVAEFHETWVANLCRGLADVVFTIGPRGHPCGFVSCTAGEDGGRIPLIAVADAARGTGAADELIRAAIAWFVERGVDEAWVKTQAQNHRAIRLYVRHAFLPARTEFVFSIALGVGSKPGGENR